MLRAFIRWLTGAESRSAAITRRLRGVSLRAEIESERQREMSRRRRVGD